MASMTKLNLGCGGNIFDGYINVGFEDGKPDSDIYLNVDLSKHFPFKDVDVVYHCHFLEHLSYQEGIRFLYRCYASMNGGAIMRILVPDLELWCMKYLQHDREFLDAYRNAYLGGDYPTDGSIFMGMLHNHGHKMGWDYETLSFWLNWIGFKNIRRTKYRESDLEDIQMLEPENPGRALESLCVECYKQA
jgi:predicted SAM-dependent methyltransferase